MSRRFGAMWSFDCTRRMRTRDERFFHSLQMPSFRLCLSPVVEGVMIISVMDVRISGDTLSHRSRHIIMSLHTSREAVS